jgi:DNA-binding Lrp family transcriptional regulator
MSNECVTIAQKRRVGSATKKAVLMYLADRASDDGSGIWTSKSHISADTELSKRSVQNAMTEFERDGLLKKTGTKKCQNGFTYEYQLVLSVLLGLPSTREKDAKLTGAGDAPVHVVHPSGAGGAPQDVHVVHPNHPITTHEPPNAREVDLFSNVPCGSSAREPKPDPQAGLIEQGWEDFKDIWPKGHPRKETGKTARAKYEAACRGKLKDSEGPVSPQDLNRAARNYIRSVREPQYIKGTVAWLNGAKFIPFLEAMKTAPDAELSSDQKIIAKYRHLNTAPPDDYIASLTGGARH